MLLKVLQNLTMKSWRDSRGLDGDAAILFVLPRVCCPGLASLCGGDDTSLCDEFYLPLFWLTCIVHVIPRFNWNYSHLGDQGVGEGGLAVVDVSDHGHVPDVLLLVHAFPHLVGCEVNLQNVSHEKILEAGKEGMSGGTGDLSLFKCWITFSGCENGILLRGLEVNKFSNRERDL